MSTFDESQITKSITYKCITRLDAYNELAAFTPVSNKMNSFYLNLFQ